MRWFILLLIGCLNIQAAGAVINVPADWPTIQLAIDNSLNGDVIIVAPGTYLESINFNGKAITVRSSDPSDAGIVLNTIIDAPGSTSVVVFDSGEGPSSVLSGFVITGGNAFCNLLDDPPWECQGGGILNRGADPTVINCSIIGNSAALEGGGMANIFGANPTVINCRFSGNTAGEDGGGMYNNNSNPSVTNCSFIGNTAAEDGGGMANFADSSPIMTNCSFTGNTAVDNGGGLHNVGGTPTVDNCSFSVNSAVTGGGMNNVASSPAVTDCSFNGNMSSDEGAGIFNLASSPMLTDCTFNWNTANANGGGLANKAGSNPILTRCSFSGNTASFNGGGMYSNLSNPTVTSTGFCSNSPDETFGGFTNGGDVSLVYCAPPMPQPIASCPADIVISGTVNVTDLLALLAAWGVCP